MPGRGGGRLFPAYSSLSTHPAPIRTRIGVGRSQPGHGSDTSMTREGQQTATTRNLQSPLGRRTGVAVDSAGQGPIEHGVDRRPGAFVAVRPQVPVDVDVVWADLWPRRACTSFTSAPCRISAEA